jgi:hypothetical protein
MINITFGCEICVKRWQKDDKFLMEVKTAKFAETFLANARIAGNYCGFSAAALRAGL